MDLRVNNVDRDLMAQAKAKAALEHKTLGQWVIALIAKAVTRKQPKENA